MLSSRLIGVTGPIVVAHAGASGHAPANTFGAYTRAHATYPDVWMEFDAQFSADDELMAIHDDTLDRTTSGSGHVADHTADQLQEIDAAKGFAEYGFEPVPRVRDLLETGRDAQWQMICEVKNIPGQRRFDQTGESYAEALCEVLDSTQFPLERLVVICFWAPTLDAIKRRDDRIALGYLSVPELPGGVKGLDAQQNADLCRRNGYHVSAPGHWTPGLSPEHVEACHADGIQVHVWTTNEAHDIERVASYGLDGITSDYPERVYGALGRPI
jgi:glycerophosphoryl diester phosphodiesterase